MALWGLDTSSSGGDSQGRLEAVRARERAPRRGAGLRAARRMLSEGRDYLREAWWIVTFPGLGIMATVLGMN